MQGDGEGEKESVKACCETCTYHHIDIIWYVCTNKESPCYLHETANSDGCEKHRERNELPSAFLKMEMVSMPQDPPATKADSRSR